MSSWQLIELDYKEDVSSFFVWLNQFQNAVWLDSSAQKTQGRYDILSAKPSHRVIATDKGTLIVNDAKVRHVEHDALETVRKLMPSARHLPSLPFTCGAIGYVCYDHGLDWLNITKSNPSLVDLPSLEFGIYHWSVVVCHEQRQAFLFYLTDCATDFIDSVMSAWEKATGDAGDFSLTVPFSPLMTRNDYAKAFYTIKENLACGNCYQVNLTHTFKASYRGDVLSAYLNLRQINPMPYGAYMSVTGGEILSFSPELFFKASDRQVMTQPIKGTAKVLDDKHKDKQQQQALSECLKNRAENLMIVDLLRNDMSRVSKPHTVDVSAFSELNTFRGVHHLVSTISSTLDDGEDHFSLFKVLFPGGSITGAPKRAAMQLIDELEINRRHVYCGAIGYFSANQQSQFNIAIRTLMTKDNDLYCAAGGGIVMDSLEEAEYQESLDKIAVITNALNTIPCGNYE